MATEEVDPRFADLDAWSLTSAMEAMWEGQLAAVAAIGHALPAITAATEAAKALFCHPNTVRYRLRKMAEITNLQLDDAKKRLAMMIELAATDTD